MKLTSIFRFTAVLLSALLLPAAPAQNLSPAVPLDRGWLSMYDLKFDDAHRLFEQWQHDHPGDSFGPASNAAAFLFSELARLGALESELFTDDARFEGRARLRPDEQLKARFQQELARADQLADQTLARSPADVGALFVKSMALGLRADSASLLDKQDLAALRFTKASRDFANRVMVLDPQAYDAYLGPGIENYLLSLKPALLRVVLKVTGSRIDREKGIEQLQMTAAHGHYLEPFAKLLLAAAALRDHNPNRARELLQELHNRFPGNPLYRRELDRLTPGAN
jgi:hypothetical protein